MISFEFITDEEFRKCLQDDSREMEACFEASSWKAVHVLAGSIIEAVMIDYLVGEGTVSREDCLKMDFGKALNVCREKKILSDKAADLSSVVKTYRNLIHPGRIVRVKETVDKSTAEVARALVTIIVDEIAGEKRKTYGLTAEQIVSKLERDSLAAAIVPHLLRVANPKEIERLLISVLPQRYIENLDEFTPAHVIPALVRCYREAFDQSLEDVKKKAVQHIVRAFKEEGDQVVSTYATAFLRASDLIFALPRDAELVKDYLLSRLENDQNPGFMGTLDGIATIINPDDALKLVDPLVRASVRGNSAARDLLLSEGIKARGEIAKSVLKRLDVWVDHFRNKGLDQKAEIVSGIKNEIEIPF